MSHDDTMTAMLKSHVIVVIDREHRGEHHTV